MNAKEKKAIEVLANITGYYEEIIYLDLDSCGVTFREAIKAMQAYASQQMPSEELIKEQYKETVCRIKNYTKCPYYNDFREGCLDCKYHRLT